MSNRTQYTWETDRTKETWENETFDTIEKCIEDYKHSCHEGELRETIFIGECDYCHISVGGEGVIERLHQDAYDSCGELAENWEPWQGKTREQWEELSNELTGVVERWLTKYGGMPRFYNIVNIQEERVK